MDKLEQIEYQRVSVIDKFQVVHLQAIYHIMRLLPQGEAQGALARKTCHIRAGMVYDGLWHGPENLCQLSFVDILGCRTNCLGFKLQILSSASKCTKT